MEENLLEIYDRFSFDNLFRFLLKQGLDPDESIIFILNNCKISALVYQERIENEYYKKISINETLSEDLRSWKQEVFNKHFKNKN